MPRPHVYGCIFLLLSGCIATVTEENAPDDAPRRAAADAGAEDTGGRIRLMEDEDSGGTLPPASDTGVVDTCEPSCAGMECGEDGCGGSCGECGAGTTCKSGICELPPSAANCPPSGPTSNYPGAIATDITLYDCDGVAFQSHSACGTPVYVYSHSESCGSCISWARSGANAFARELDAAGAEFWFIITIGRGYAPDAAECARVRSEYGLEMPVLFVRDMWDFAEAYGSTGAGPGALLDADHEIVVTGSAKSSYDRSTILGAAGRL